MTFSKIANTIYAKAEEHGMRPKLYILLRISSNTSAIRSKLTEPVEDLMNLTTMNTVLETVPRKMMIQSDLAARQFVKNCIVSANYLQRFTRESNQKIVAKIDINCPKNCSKDFDKLFENCVQKSISTII